MSTKSPATAPTDKDLADRALDEEVSASTAPSVDVGELTILIRPHDSAHCEYIGTRMQIEAEGVIPEGIKWPDGFINNFWQANGFRYWLRRQRPEGVKGPRRNFLFCDNWCLCISKEEPPGYSEAIARKEKELQTLRKHQTQEWITVSNEQFRRCCAARTDEKFQEFMSLFPAIELSKGKKRGRPPIVKENRHA